jgi:hypothetical protein
VMLRTLAAQAVFHPFPIKDTLPFGNRSAFPAQINRLS